MSDYVEKSDYEKELDHKSMRVRYIAIAVVLVLAIAAAVIFS